MARISSRFDISGTYGNLVVYKVGNKLYARTRSSLTVSRFRKDPAFAKSREKAQQFGEAAVLAKTIYAILPKAIKKQGLFGQLTGQIHKWLQEGKTKEVILKEVLAYYGIPPSFPTKVAKPFTALIQQKPVQPLSHWLVTAKGQLQTYTTFPVLYHSYFQAAITVTKLTDDG